MWGRQPGEVWKCPRASWLESVLRRAWLARPSKPCLSRMKGRLSSSWVGVDWVVVHFCVPHYAIDWSIDRLDDWPTGWPEELMMCYYLALMMYYYLAFGIWDALLFGKCHHLFVLKGFISRQRKGVYLAVDGSVDRLMQWWVHVLQLLCSWLNSFIGAYLAVVVD